MQCNRQSSDKISGQTKVVIRLQFEVMYVTKATMQFSNIHKSKSHCSKVKRKLLVSFYVSLPSAILLLFFYFSFTCHFVYQFIIALSYIPPIYHLIGEKTLTWTRPHNTYIEFIWLLDIG